MTVRSYTDVSIQNNQLSSVENAQKSLEKESALNTLDRIEEVICKNLSDSNRSQDEHDRIEKSEIIFPILNLPAELIQHVFGFLPSLDLMKMAQASKSSDVIVKEIHVSRARDYGYIGNNFSEAKGYLNGISESIDTLVKKGHLPKEYVATYNPFPSRCNVDAHGTLEKIKNLGREEKEALKTSISKALFEYVTAEQLEIVKVLLKFGAILDTKNNQSEASLYMIRSLLFKYDIRKSFISLFLSYDANPNIIDEEGFTPLCLNTGYPEITELLCKKGANVNHKTNRGYSPLHYSVLEEELETARVLLKYGADPNLKTNKEETPLLFAMRSIFGNNIKKEIAVLLLSYNADPNIPDNDGFTPFCYADYPEITVLFCHKNANVNQKTRPEGNYPLHFAAMKLQLETTKILLKCGANPNVQNDKGETPLHSAMHLGITYDIKMNFRIAYDIKKELVPLLLSHGADPNIADKYGFTPICLETCYPEITELLCKKNANVNQKTNPDGNYPLHFAIRNEDVETAKILLKYDANPNVRNNKGETPLFLALNKNTNSINKAFVSLLLSYGADPNIPNNDGFIPICIDTSDLEFTELFCEEKVDVKE